MTSSRISVSSLTLYNPARLRDPEIVATFVARQALFERLLADIAAEKPKSRAQHHLIVGQRGMGKSTMLARLAAELRMNADLSRRFIPLVFAEEQYAVDRLAKFWLNCLDSLADAAERVGDTATSERIDALVQQLKSGSGSTREEDGTPVSPALAALLELAESGGKRLVLLVDNLQLVFERLKEIEQHALREILMQPGSPILIGASPSPPPETQDYGAAFYDSFKVHYLRPLSADEMRSLMFRLADHTGRADVRNKVLAHPERLKALADLTGGNPRTLVTLFFLYTEDFSPSVFADLENLLDRVTPFYKARIEELSEQQQVIVSVVADHWAPLTARTLATASGLPMPTISSQLDRLEKTGFVEKVEIFGQTGAGYQIAERFFNVWFLMRSASRRQRREVEFLVRFLESFYLADDRARLAQHLLKEHDFSPDRYQFAKALAHTLDPNNKEDLARHTELDALRQKAAEARQRLAEVIDFSKLPPATLAFDQMRQKLEALVPAGAEITPDAFAKEVLGDRQMFLRQERERLAARPHKLNARDIRAILESIAETRELAVREYDEDSVAWFCERLASGQLRSVNDVDDWNRAFLQACHRKVVQLMVDSIPLQIGSTLSEKVRLKIQSELTPKEDSDAPEWERWGNRLQRCLGRFEEAESAFRKAIELNPNFAWPWHGLGNLFQDEGGRFEEAEAAYRKAIELDPKLPWPWNGLGHLFQFKLKRFEDAEAAYRKAIELDPDYSWPWKGLGLLLRELGRYEEAGTVLRKAIELDPNLPWLWNGLGALFQNNLGRYDEAEAAYRKAIELDPTIPWPWESLGVLFHHKLGKPEEAEAAYRNAIKLDPTHVLPWIGLGRLYANQHRYSQAAEAFAKALEIDDPLGFARKWLIGLFRDYLGEIGAAKRLLEAWQAKPQGDSPHLVYLHKALFAAYDSNWGICADALAKALEIAGYQISSETATDWCWASAVLLHLNYGDELLALLRTQGGEARLRPWYEAISALQRGDRHYLQNIPAEVRKTAEYYFDEIEKVLNTLPESTRRRPVPAPTSRRPKSGTEKR